MLWTEASGRHQSFIYVSLRACSSPELSFLKTGFLVFCHLICLLLLACPAKVLRRVCTAFAKTILGVPVLQAPPSAITPRCGLWQLTSYLKSLSLVWALGLISIERTVWSPFFTRMHTWLCNITFSSPLSFISFVLFIVGSCNHLEEKAEEEREMLPKCLQCDQTSD